jgi:vacuolar-type H+-ATPase subunit H
MADLTGKVDDLITLVTGARAMPLSASCVLNRDELLRALTEVRGIVPVDVAAARAMMADRDAIIADARARAEGILATAELERARLVSETNLVRDARDEADRIVAAARQAARSMRTEIDEYVDGKLATFEVVLTRTMASVARGRDRLAGRTGYGQLADAATPPGAGHVVVEPRPGDTGAPAPQGPVPVEPVPTEPVQHGPVQHGPVQHGPVPRGPVPRGPVPPDGVPAEGTPDVRVLAGPPDPLVDRPADVPRQPTAPTAPTGRPEARHRAPAGGRGDGTRAKRGKGPAGAGGATGPADGAG